MSPKCSFNSLRTLWLIGQPAMWFRTETHIWGNWLDVMWTSPCCAVCVCVCARAHGPAARAAVTRQWDTHVKDFCGSFARIINTVKFCFRNQNTFACSLWNYTYDWQVWELRVESFGETSLCSFFSYLKVRINSLMSPRAKSTISSPLCVG